MTGKQFGAPTTIEQVRERLKAVQLSLEQAGSANSESVEGWLQSVCETVKDGDQLECATLESVCTGLQCIIASLSISKVFRFEFNLILTIQLCLEQLPDNFGEVSQ
eukprot:m.291726 g.291726  ORF g.291726 m.291726 type:complete len:106 (+) comp16384_c0_seq59:166-483(+)